MVRKIITYPDTSEIVDSDYHVFQHGQLVAKTGNETFKDGETPDFEELLEKIVVEKRRTKF